jgi:thiol-disulfide isomerase/thioredoxin
MKYNLCTFNLLMLACTNFVFSQQESTKSTYLKVEKNDTVFKRVFLQELKNEFYMDVFFDKSKNETGNIDIEFTIATPTLFRFYSLEPQTLPLIVFIQPGDLIYYKLAENNLMSFEGKNAGHYNFFAKLSDPSYYYPKYDLNEGIRKNRENVDLIYNRKLQALEAYVKDNTVSDLFKIRVKDVLYYEYLNHVLAKFKIPTDVMRDNPSYLEEVDFQVFNRNDQQDNFYFYLALMNYLHFYAAVNDKSDAYSKQNLEFRLNFIRSKLSDNTKEYAITKTLIEFEKHLKSENIDFLKETIDTNLLQIKDINYREALEQIRQKITILGSKLPQEVLNAKFIAIDGNHITLEEILKTKEGKVKVIDFWASWCAPCISEIKKTHQFRDKMNTEKNVEFLYFSIDESQEKWRSKVVQLKDFGMDENQYLMTKETNSILQNYFTITSIPKYAILNAVNETIMGTIPAPNDSGEFEKIINKVLEKK